MMTKPPHLRLPSTPPFWTTPVSFLLMSHLCYTATDTSRGGGANVTQVILFQQPNHEDSEDSKKKRMIVSTSSLLFFANCASAFRFHHHHSSTRGLHLETRSSQLRWNNHHLQPSLTSLKRTSTQQQRRRIYYKRDDEDDEIARQKVRTARGGHKQCAAVLD